MAKGAWGVPDFRLPDRRRWPCCRGPLTLEWSDFDRKIDLDVSTEEKAYEVGYFPLDLVFDATRSTAWRRGYSRHFGLDEGKLDQWDKFEIPVLHRFHQYRVPIIELLQTTPKDAVCSIRNREYRGVAWRSSS